MDIQSLNHRRTCGITNISCTRPYLEENIFYLCETNILFHFKQFMKIFYTILRLHVLLHLPIDASSFLWIRHNLPDSFSDKMAYTGLAVNRKKNLLDIESLSTNHTARKITVWVTDNWTIKYRAVTVNMKNQPFFVINLMPLSRLSCVLDF